MVIMDDAISDGNIVKDEDENNYGLTSSLSLKLVDQRLDLVPHLLVLFLLVLHLTLWRIWKKVTSYKHNNIHRLTKKQIHVRTLSTICKHTLQSITKYITYL